MFNTVIKWPMLPASSFMYERRRNDLGMYEPVSDEPLSKTIRGARFPLSVDKILSELPDKSTFIRTAVIDKLIADGLLEEPEQS